MSKFEVYNIVLNDLYNETRVYEYDLDDLYFSKIDSPEVSKGNVKATVKVKSIEKTFELDFKLEGTILIPCDRCLDNMSQHISHKEKILVKLGKEYADEDDVVIVPEAEGAINIAWFLYEFIVINIPLKHVHPTGECNKTMATKLKSHSTKSKVYEDEGSEDDSDDSDDGIEIENEQTDPRWDGLKNILDNN